MFAHRKARAYIGYSETLHSALQEVQDDCMPYEQCRTEDRIAVRALPPITPGGQLVGWVDALTIHAGLADSKAALAREFIDFVTSWKAYQSILNPDWPDAPCYLLPAVEVPDGAPLKPVLYPALTAAFGSRLIATAPHLNDDLRARGKKLNCILPPERQDPKWQKDCPGAVE
jgi:hypothetical protein